MTAAAQPFTLDGVDDEILADLAAVGVAINTDETGFRLVETDDAAKRAAMAALFLRLAGEADDEIERHKAAMMKQVELVTEHYNRQMAPAVQRRDMFLRHAQNLAEIAALSGDFGKKKSASTPWGDFGVQDRKAAVQLTDPAALLEHLKVAAPQYVRVSVKLPLAQALEYLSPTELEATKMEPAWGDYKKTIDPDVPAPPPGVERVEAARVPFAKLVRPFLGGAE